MKQILILIVAFFTFITSASSQNIFDKSQPITWLGIDFSALRFIKSDETISNEELQDKYFIGWNDLIVSEPKKYDIAAATGRSEVANSVEGINKLNAAAKGPFINESGGDFQHLDASKVKQMVKKYDLKGKSGIGLVFIYEGMDKTKKKGSIWVTFVNMSTKEVLRTEQIAAESGGFGFRNYWAGVITKVIKGLPSNMKKWQKG